MIIVIVCYFINITLTAQEAFHNFGNIKIHDQGQIGFHTNLINDGTFNQNRGLAGFYHQDENLTISGNNKPAFHDMEIDVPSDLLLEVAVGVTNFQEFIRGRVITPRDKKIVSLDYMKDAPYLGADDNRFVDGYASITGTLDFTFPIGDDYRLRPMRIDNQAAINTARGAYFFANPNFPNYFPKSFDTNTYGDDLYGVSVFEFWDLDGETETRVTLTWDDNSNINTLVDDLEDLRVVGWHKLENKWVNLGRTNTSGDFTNGEITSASIIPDRYEVLTFGSSELLLDGDLEIYTGISPNGDGINDTFIIQGLAQFPDNELFIYNRWGVLIYSKEKYHLDQNFAGISEGRTTINKTKELPVGTYYYVLNIKGEKDRAGYLYINR